MTTIGSPVYCGNSNYPLWLANGAPINSPTTVIDNLTKALTTSVTESNTTITYNDYPATTQAYSGIVFSKNGGTGSNSALFLQTNGQTNLAVNGGGNAVQTFAPLQVTNAEGNFLQVSPEAISFNGVASNALTIADGGQFSIGQTVDITPGVLAVYDPATNIESDLKPGVLALGAYANTTSSITQDFSGQSLAGPSYQAQRPVFGGITWTTSGGTPADAGITKVNPGLSSKAVTTSGAAYPGATAQCAYLGNYSVSAPQPVGTWNGFIMPTLTAAQPGETVTLSYAYAGGQTGRIIANGITIQTIPSSAVWVNASTTFVSTGNDEVEFQTQVIPYTGNASQWNITNITFTYTVASVSTPQVSLATGGRNSTNYGILNLSSLSNNGTTLGSYIQVGDVYNGITAVSAGGSSILANSNITLTAPTVNISSNMSLTNGANISFTSGPSQMFLNAGSNTYFNIANGGGALYQLTGNSHYFSGGGVNLQTTNLYMNSSSLVMNGTANITMNNNNLTGASNVSSSNVIAQQIDALGGTYLSIGFSSSNTSMSNVTQITFTPVARAFGQLNNLAYINNGPACATGTYHYLANFNGTKGISTPLPPKASLSGRNNTTFGSNFTSDSFTGTVGFTLPTYSVFSYSNIGSGVTTTISNNQSVPYYYADTGPGFSPSSSSQAYSLNPILT